MHTPKKIQYICLSALFLLFALKGYSQSKTEALRAELAKSKAYTDSIEVRINDPEKFFKFQTEIGNLKQQIAVQNQQMQSEKIAAERQFASINALLQSEKNEKNRLSAQIQNLNTQLANERSKAASQASDLRAQLNLSKEQQRTTQNNSQNIQRELDNEKRLSSQRKSELDNKNVQALGDKERLTLEKNNLTKQIEILRSEKTESQNAKTEAERQYNASRQQLVVLSNEKEQITQQLKEANAKGENQSALREEIASLQGQLQVSKAETLKANQGSQSEVETLSQKNQDLGREVTQLKSQLAESQKNASQVTTQMTQQNNLKREFEKLQLENNQLKKDIIASQKQMGEQAQANVQPDSQPSDNDAKVTALQQQLAAALQSSQETQKEFKSIQKENTNLKAETVALRKQVDAKTAPKQAPKNDLEVETLTQQLAGANAKVMETEKKSELAIKTLQQEKAALDSKNQQLSGEISELKEAKAALRKEVDAKPAPKKAPKNDLEVETLTKQLAGANAKVMETEKKSELAIKTLQQEKAVLDSKNQQLSGEISKLNEATKATPDPVQTQASNEAEQKLKRENEALKSQMAALMSSGKGTKELENKLNESTKANESLKKENTKSQQEINSLKQLLELNKKNVSSLRDQLAAAKAATPPPASNDANINRLSAQKISLMKQVDSLNMQLAARKALADEKSAEAAKFEKEKNELVSERDQLKTQLAALSEKDTPQAENTTVKTDSVNTGLNIQYLTEQTNKLTVEIVSLNQKLEDKEIEFKNLLEKENDQQHELEYENKKLKAEKNNLNKEIQSLTNQSQSGTEELSTQLKTSQEENANLQLEIQKGKDDLRQQRIDLLKQSAEKESKMRSDFNERTHRQREEIEALRKKLATAEAAASQSSSSQLQALQARIQQLEAENKRLFDKMNN